MIVFNFNEMEPISKKKSSVSPYIKTETPESPAPDTPAPDPITKALSGNTILAPQVSVSSADIIAIDKRIDGLINYLEKWIKVGNLNMSNIKEYVENFNP